MEYASIPAVWQEKKDVPPGISRTEKLRNIPAPRLPSLPPLRPQSVLPELGGSAPRSKKNPLPTGSPHSALPRSCDCPFPQGKSCSRKVQSPPRCSPPDRNVCNAPADQPLTAPLFISAPAQERLPTSRGSFHAKRLARAPCRIKRTSFYETRKKNDTRAAPSLPAGPALRAIPHRPPAPAIDRKKALSPEGKRALLPAWPERIRRSSGRLRESAEEIMRGRKRGFYGNSHHSGAGGMPFCRRSGGR